MNTPVAQRIWLLLLPLTLVLLTGCSSFNREWKKAMKQPDATPIQGITGPWEGTWLSDYNGHTGPLRCLITPGTNGTYMAWFHAKYKKVITLSFAYTVSLHPVQSDQNQKVVFSGEEDLGKLAGGVYRYQGRADDTNFFSNYRSPYDHGTFQMTRP